MTAFKRVRGRKPKRAELPADATVSRDSWTLAECARHGRTAHLASLGGRCCQCQEEALNASAPTVATPSR